MWENIQKGMQRVQQSGSKYVWRRTMNRMTIVLMDIIDSAALAEAHQLLEGRWEGWPVC